jgi:hypothetical protein
MKKKTRKKRVRRSKKTHFFFDGAWWPKDFKLRTYLKF